MLVKIHFFKEYIMEKIEAYEVESYNVKGYKVIPYTDEELEQLSRGVAVPTAEEMEEQNDESD